MTFSDYIQTTYLALAPAPNMTQAQYVSYFCCLLIEGKYHEKIDSAQLRICKMEETDRGKVFRGNRPLTKSDAKYICQHWTDKYLYEKILKAPREPKYEMFEAFERQGMEFTSDDTESKAQTVADNLKELINGIAFHKRTSSINVEHKDDDYYSVASFEGICVYNQQEGILNVGGRIVKIDPIIAPEEVAPSEEERLYIKALLEIFSDLLGEEIDSIIELKVSDPNLYKELISNRECFYSAESIRHIIRDAFSDGEEYFTKYKDELYEGVIVVHHMNYADGYDRLQAVLNKSTLMNLNCQKLERLYIIGAKEKKGICHMLVDEGKITSWIKRF